MNADQQQFQRNLHADPASGLTRYRSAPSSYFATFLDTASNGGDDFEHDLFIPPETQRILSRFMSSTDTAIENSPAANARMSANPPPPMMEADPRRPLRAQQNKYYSSASQSGLYPEPGSSGAAVEDSHSGLLDSYAGHRLKMEPGGGGGGGNSSGLLRRSSSAVAGLFPNIDIKNEPLSSSSTALNSQIDFPSSYFSTGMMNTIPETDFDGIVENVADARPNVDPITGLDIGSWDDSDGFLRELPDNEGPRFLIADASVDQVGMGQENEVADRPTTTHLAHHLSLPTSSAELSAMEKTMQDTVPCKMRAKRGFATHPRSIAERVRRTKISDRIRKLQEVVPNMEKQTNTCDMLELAVDYIKDLQRQVKVLGDDCARCSCPCSCSAKQNQ